MFSWGPIGFRKPAISYTRTIYFQETLGIYGTLVGFRNIGSYFQSSMRSLSDICL